MALRLSNPPFVYLYMYLNLSAAATLGTEESGSHGEVVV